MSYEIEKKTIVAQPIAYGSASGSADEIPQLLGQILPNVLKHVNANGGKVAGPPFTHYLQMGDTIQFQAGIPLQKSIAAGGEVDVGELPGGEVLRTVHIGPYDELSKAYAALVSYVEENGLNAGDTMWEYYWTDPEEEPNPQNWKTELFLPLAG